MTNALLTLEQMDAGVKFFHDADERAYFEWLKRIPCVANVYGDGKRGLIVKLKRRPGEQDLRQLLALGQRYGLNMSQFTKFETDANRVWFRNPIAYWYPAVFDGS